MKNIVTLSIIIILVSISCGSGPEDADAWGNFEAEEILVSSEAAGRILSFPAKEGLVLAEGSRLALIDTTLISLQLIELDASKNSVKTRALTIDSQNGILKQQIKNIEINVSRIEKMLEEDAATQKQLDDLTGQVAVLEKQIIANNSQKSLIHSELRVLDSRRNQLLEKLSRCEISAPLEGTIVEKYAEEGEITAQGKPLVKIANLKTMELRVYVSGGQLAEISVGNTCRVRLDRGAEDFYEYSGKIMTVSDQAEFTPKIIQTREERVSLVYAVTIEVENDGKIKSGMPGEAIFSPNEK